MDYEKLYKEALNLAKSYYENHEGGANQFLDTIFPELRESEDERIRKEIIQFLQLPHPQFIGKRNHKKWISWLEKQGEKETDEWKENDIIKSGDILALVIKGRRAMKSNGEIFTVQYPDEWVKAKPNEIEYFLNELGKQCEQKQIEEYDVPDTSIKDSEAVTSRIKYIDENLKPIAEFVMDYVSWDLRKDEWNHPVATVPLFRVLDALVQNGKQYSEEHHVVDNNTKPKFNVGDWITNGDYTWKVIDIKPLDYILQSQDGNVVDDTISHVDGNFSSFTIEDAKDGDVLAAHECLVLFKEIDGLNIRCYCTYHYLNHQAFYVDTLQNKTAFHPATKEQHDLLFQKMKEEGYKWDTNKKELKKIEQKPAWSEEDEYQINTILHELDLKREIYKKEGNKVEEDRYNTQYNWLKSFKSNHWKPTEYDISLLEEIARNIRNNIRPFCSEVSSLEALIDNLKNL